MDGKKVIGIESLSHSGPAPERELCTDCGISRSSDPKRCGRACQFIDPQYESLEQAIHGKDRALSGDQLFFGVYRKMYRASMHDPLKGAQWTGITTSIASQLLKNNLVDAVLTMAPDPDDRWRPMPVLITDAKELYQARGMRMGYAPLLALLDVARERNYQRLGVIGIPCQVYALRALEKELNLKKLYVIGTPCSDNTSTENFHEFLQLIDESPEEITYLEFRADYHVELRYQDGRKKTIPFLMLPLSKLRPDFFPLTCRTCVDYTNALSDITVGYMGGSGEQWLIVRNQQGEELLNLLGNQIKLSEPESAGNRVGPVKGFMKNVELAAGGLPLRQMPNWLRPIVGWLMPKIGPRGLEFARARVEMKAIETVLHLRRELPKKMKNMVPNHVWLLVKPYSLEAKSDELKNHLERNNK
ncbi:MULTISPECIES: Coenzyme F420 hydrogenase/dehydrogenase, beta subunit C-terminal domain [unclassified Polynucleobacter]|uniref:Coenzyme F420 hydrogenase/dehydrogenase, beta subunit C-terminal domain n=1 Tax=unclassified Polynucleobacter TaxID=2640945 RepID=UPI0025726A86|nr:MULTISPECIES: Coenzyme F420 hydrogenase/dehydrogenase, beta subunit C-terminal domain [unclassified Polynucleobacter]BEI43403.1 Coenzyme F420 hydrogenase/dehydrogenase, beta subunit C-terminal domain [Polynucleobacter sp. HIN10]BEI45180.1 Coenzyme F420 hydrogenase/dehydrogenase, beta subunit C-terminal domain [Polynucleobacter sp. HIN11]